MMITSNDMKQALEIYSGKFVNKKLAERLLQIKYSNEKYNGLNFTYEQFNNIISISNLPMPNCLIWLFNPLDISSVEEFDNLSYGEWVG